MKRMVEMDCCDVCGAPLYAEPGYLESYPFKDSNGKEFEALFCEDCFNDKVVCCSGCGCFLCAEDTFSFDNSDAAYCEKCAEKAIEDKLQEIEDLKAELKDARAAFERRKAERG